MINGSAANVFRWLLGLQSSVLYFVCGIKDCAHRNVRFYLSGFLEKKDPAFKWLGVRYFLRNNLSTLRRTSKIKLHALVWLGLKYKNPVRITAAYRSKWDALYNDKLACCQCFKIVIRIAISSALSVLVKVYAHRRLRFYLPCFSVRCFLRINVLKFRRINKIKIECISGARP